jgi:hypothetical protein
MKIYDLFIKKPFFEILSGFLHFAHFKYSEWGIKKSVFILVQKSKLDLCKSASKKVAAKNLFCK